MNNEKWNEPIDWVAIVGFFLIIGYFYLVFAAYNNLHPSLNQNLEDNYPPFENPRGSFGTAILSSLCYWVLKIIILFILTAILFVFFYCCSGLIKTFQFFLKGTKQNEQKNKRPQKKEQNTTSNK